MSTREQTKMICDGCSLEIETPREMSPDGWVCVSRTDRTKHEDYCDECWRIGILAILKRPRDP